jgi:hypothetical protein
MNETIRFYPHMQSTTHVLKHGIQFASATFVAAGALSTSGIVTIDSTAQKIRGFSNLSPGWHYGEGKAPSEAMIDAAIGWNSTLLSAGFSTTDAFPGTHGEVMITGYYGPHYIEILLETDFGVTLTYEINNQEKKYLERVAAAVAYAALQEIAGEIWNTSAYSIQSTLTVSSMSSKAWPSRTQVMEPQLFNEPALTPLELPSANILGGIIRMSEANLRFFGSSMSLRSPRIAA